jgi:hypothetical protein
MKVKQYFTPAEKFKVTGSKISEIASIKIELMIEGELYKRINIRASDRCRINNRIDDLLRHYNKFLEKKNWEVYVCILKEPTPETWTMIPDYE